MFGYPLTQSPRFAGTLPQAMPSCWPLRPTLTMRSMLLLQELSSCVRLPAQPESPSLVLLWTQNLPVTWAWRGSIAITRKGKHKENVFSPFSAGTCYQAHLLQFPVGLFQEDQPGRQAQWTQETQLGNDLVCFLLNLPIHLKFYEWLRLCFKCDKLLLGAMFLAIRFLHLSISIQKWCLWCPHPSGLILQLALTNRPSPSLVAQFEFRKYTGSLYSTLHELTWVEWGPLSCAFLYMSTLCLIHSSPGPYRADHPIVERPTHK